jgi:uncharacterized RDD family membrane protein YckC
VEAEKGAYFRLEDYASFWVRVLVDLVDVLVFGILCVMLATCVLVIFPLNRTALNVIFLSWMAVAFSYFVVLKRSTFRTLGYRLGGVRIVALNGQPPTYSSLAFRLMFGMLGPINWIVDLVWLLNDTNRQSLRDKFAGTYVVKTKSQTAGEGQIVFRQYNFLLFNCLFREVQADPKVR